MNRLRTLISACVALGLVATLVGGCAQPPSGSPSGEAPGGSVPPPPAPPDSGTVKIYVPDVDQDGELVLVSRNVATSSEEPGPVEALQALMDYTRDGNRIFPEGAKVLGFRVDENGTAVVDFSSQLQSFSGGSMEEAGAVNAIVLTASQFPKVQRVLMTLEGQELESLGGHLDLTVPQEPDERLIEENH